MVPAGEYTVQAYCAALGISERTLLAWRKKQSLRPGVTVVSHPGQKRLTVVVREVSDG